MLIRKQNEINAVNNTNKKWLTPLALNLIKLTMQKGIMDNYLLHYSLPVSSDINTIPGYLYDESLRDVWRSSKIRIPKNNDKRSKDYGLSYKELFIKYFSDSLSRQGYLNHAFIFYEWMSKNGNTEFRLVGELGLLDISILVSRWNFQLQNYYKKNIWFNPDDIIPNNDTLSKLFKICNDNLVNSLYKKCKKLNSKCVLSEVMYAGYLQANYQNNQALFHYKQALSYVPNNEICKHFCLNSSLLSNKINNNKDYILAELTHASHLCKKNSWSIKSLESSAEITCTYKVFLNKKSIIRQSKLSSHNNKLVELYNVWEIGSGILITSINDKKYLVLESNHLQLPYLKMFTTSIIQFDNTHALIRERENEHKLYYNKAFILPGTGWSYHHWIIETTPLLEAYKDKGLIDSLPLYFPYSLKSWHMETLKLLGLESAKIIPFIPNKRIFFNKLIMPTFSAKDLVPSYSNIEFIRKNLSKPKPVRKGKYVYITRKHVTSFRKMGNQYKLERLLKKKGFHFIDPALLTVTEQIDYFSDVDVLVAEGGASNCNLLFCPKQTKAIFLSADRALYDSHSFIAGFIGQELTYILGESHPSPCPYYLWTSYSFNPDIDTLSSCLEEIL